MLNSVPLPYEAPWAWLAAATLIGIVSSVALWTCARNARRHAPPCTRALSALVYAAFAGVPFFWALAVLFGADAVSAPTAAWAVMQASFTALPLFLSWGSLDGVFFALQHASERREHPFVIPAAASLLGSWLSCVVVPLDWEQPWQVWPIPCIYGALGGAFCGWCACACLLLCGRRC